MGPNTGRPKHANSLPSEEELWRDIHSLISIAIDYEHAIKYPNIKSVLIKTHLSCSFDEIESQYNDSQLSDNLVNWLSNAYATSQTKQSLQDDLKHIHYNSGLITECPLDEFIRLMTPQEERWDQGTRALATTYVDNLLTKLNKKKSRTLTDKSYLNNFSEIEDTDDIIINSSKSTLLEIINSYRHFSKESAKKAIDQLEVIWE